jgi:hypothetical protein
MPPTERKIKSSISSPPYPPDQALSWQQLQIVKTADAKASTLSPLTMAAALEECEIKFIVNLPQSELQSTDRLFFQIEQVRASRRLSFKQLEDDFFIISFICNPSGPQELLYKDRLIVSLYLLCPLSKQAYWYYEDKIADADDNLLRNMTFEKFALQVWLGCP